MTPIPVTAKTVFLMIDNFMFPSSCLLYTSPLTDTFSFARPGSIAFHGTADPWAETDSIRTLAEQKEVPLFLTPNANHSLETGDVQTDLSIIKATMAVSYTHLDVYKRQPCGQQAPELLSL